MTFYKSVDQLPPFEDYDMKGRTYRFFEDSPLYAFGFGLSYTNFKYSNLSVPEEVSSDKEFTVTVEVENTGEMEGDEVVQLYLRHNDVGVPVPIHTLKGFKRIHLNKGEKKTVEFLLSPEQLTVIDDQSNKVVLPGSLTLYLGGSQPDKNKLESSEILSKTVQIKGEKFIVE